MSDEFDIVHISHDDSQGIINWAVQASALVVMMHNMPLEPDVPQNDVDALLEAVDIMISNMPDGLRNHAALLATEIVDAAVQEEELVEEFQKELEGL